MSTSSYRATSEDQFPTELPTYGVWWGEDRFTLHKNLSVVKGAISTRVPEGLWDWKQGGRAKPVGLPEDVKVYERHGSSWHLIYHLPQGTFHREHELWAGPAPKTTVAVTDEDIAKVIESITGTRPEV